MKFRRGHFRAKPGPFGKAINVINQWHAQHSDGVRVGRVFTAKDAVTIRLLVRVDELCARLATVEAENSVLRTRVAELEAKLGLPPKTPNNSSTPPSQGRNASGEEKNKSEGEPRKAHAGAHRPLHPDPTSRRDVTAKACQHCGADVSRRPQTACEAYDHVEIPGIKPDVTRVMLFGGTCPCCAKKFKAPAPQDMT